MFGIIFRKFFGLACCILCLSALGVIFESVPVVGFFVIFVFRVAMVYMTLDCIYSVAVECKSKKMEDNAENKLDDSLHYNKISEISYSEKCVHEEHKEDYDAPYGTVKDKESESSNCIHDEHKEDKNSESSLNSGLSLDTSISYPDANSIWEEYMK